MRRRQDLVQHVNALAASVMRGGDAGELVRLVQRVVVGTAAADAVRSAGARLSRRRRAARRKRVPRPCA